MRFHARLRPAVFLASSAGLVAVLGLLLVGCGSDNSSANNGGSGNTGSGNAGRPAAGLSTTAVFDRIPRYPRSTSASSRTKNSDGTLVQSFTVKGATPSAILAYYVDLMPRDGWTAAQRPTTEGTAGRRGSWRRNRRTLVISSAPAPAAGSGQQEDARLTQYSLLLYPPGAGPS